MANPYRREFKDSNGKPTPVDEYVEDTQENWLFTEKINEDDDVDRAALRIRHGARQACSKLRKDWDDVRHAITENERGFRALVWILTQYLGDSTLMDDGSVLVDTGKKLVNTKDYVSVALSLGWKE